MSIIYKDNISHLHQYNSYIYYIYIYEINPILLERHFPLLNLKLWPECHVLKSSPITMINFSMPAFASSIDGVLHHSSKHIITCMTNHFYILLRMPNSASRSTTLLSF